MQVSSISLPWLNNKTTDIMDAGTAQSYSNTQEKRDKLKYKKITDYTKDVRASYKTLRNINNITVNESENFPEYTWLSTRYSGSPVYTYIIHPSGLIVWNFTFYADGLRPVITK